MGKTKQTYRSAVKAREVADRMRGWAVVRVRQVTTPDGTRGYIITTEGGTLREDGTIQ